MTDKKIKATFDGGPLDGLGALVPIDKFKSGEIILDDSGHIVEGTSYQGAQYVYTCKAKKDKPVLELKRVIDDE